MYKRAEEHSTLCSVTVQVGSGKDLEEEGSGRGHVWRRSGSRLEQDSTLRIVG